MAEVGFTFFSPSPYIRERSIKACQEIQRGIEYAWTIIHAYAVPLVLSSFLFYWQPNLAFIAFTIGFVGARWVKVILEQVDTLSYLSVWEKTCFSLAGFWAVIHMPVALCTATCYYGLRWGVLLADRAQSPHDRALAFNPLEN